MAAKAVQVSMDPDLLRRIDADPEARQQGRSAFIRSALVLYLEAKRRRAADAAILRAYGGKADEIMLEIQGLMEAQTWPER